MDRATCGAMIGAGRGRPMFLRSSWRLPLGGPVHRQAHRPSPEGLKGVTNLNRVAGSLLAVLALLPLPASAQIFRTETAGTGSGELRRGPLVAKLQHRRQQAADGTVTLQPQVEVRLHGQLVGRLKGAELVGLGRPEAVMQIAELDPSNPYPEVWLSSFTGGAHCCNDIRVLTSDQAGQTWRQVSLGPFNGITSNATDPLGSGRLVLVDVDNRFLYQFSSYAGSWAPLRIWQLQGERFIDRSHQRAYRPLHRRQLKEMAGWFGEPNPIEPNGFLAGYVASKALVGELESGWQQMLKRYDRRSDWGLKQCRAGYDEAGRCKRAEAVYPAFPAALRAFLVDTGYISPAEL